MTAEEAMQGIWAEICPDCGPEDYALIVWEVAAMHRYLRKTSPTAPGAMPAWLVPETDAEVFSPPAERGGQ